MTTLRLEVLNHPELDERLKLAQLTPELPSWWRCEKHDKDLLIGVSKHGITRTDFNILEDPELSFYEIKSEMDAQHIALAGWFCRSRCQYFLPMSVFSKTQIHVLFCTLDNCISNCSNFFCPVLIISY